VPVALYMDAHIPRSITLGLRLRGVDVLTAQEDHGAGLPDPELMERATTLNRVLFSFDDDLLVEAARRQGEMAMFSGLIYAHPLQVAIGHCVRDLELIAKTVQPNDFVSRVEFLPL